MGEIVKLLTPVQEACAKVLPATMLVIAHENLRTHGWTPNNEIVIYCQRAMKACYKGLDPLMTSIVADKVTQEAHAIMKAANAGKSTTLWVATAHAILKAKARGVSFEENVLLACMAIEFEIVEVPEDYGGRFAIEQASNRIDNEALARGFWLEVASAIMN